MTTENKPTVLVFGATGKIGGALARELRANPGAENVQIVAAVRKPEQVEQFFETITGKKPTSLREFAQKHRQELEY